MRLPAPNRERAVPRVADLAATVTLGAGALAAVTLDWSLPSHRWVGLAAQAAAGLVGIIGCIRVMARS